MIRGVNVLRVWTTNFGRHTLIGRSLDYLSFYFNCFRMLQNLLDKNTIVVAKTDPPLISVVAGWAVRRHDALLVNWLQDLFPEVAMQVYRQSYWRPFFAFLKNLRNHSLEAANRNIVISAAMKERLTDQGCASDSIFCIRDWSTLDLGKNFPDGEALRKKWGMKDRFVVAYSGNLGRAHDWETLADAILRLQSRSDICFLFIGGGYGMDRLKRRLGNTGQAQIIFKPYQPADQLAESLSVADVHLVSLLPEMEGLIFPSKLYAVMQLAKPVVFIGNKNTEIANILDTADCGRAVMTGDPAALAAIIVELQNDPRQCRQLGNNAAKYHERHFRRNIVLEKWWTLLDGVATG